jgi:hypothetical protein
VMPVVSVRRHGGCQRGAGERAQEAAWGIH